MVRVQTECPDDTVAVLLFASRQVQEAEARGGQWLQTLLQADMDM